MMLKRLIQAGALCAGSLFSGLSLGQTGVVIDTEDQQSDVESKIVGGVKSTTNYSWIVSLQKDGSHFCGGSLITPNWVLTASHCVENVDEDDVKLIIGGLDNAEASTNGEVRYVDQIIMHDDYSDANGVLDNDVALLALRSPSTKTPIAIADQSVSSALTSGTYVKTLGWGLTNQNASSGEQFLREVAVSFQSDSACASVYEQDASYWQRNLCAGESGGGYDSCQGDSGGPLVVEVDGQDTLAGVVSYGNGCAQPGQYGVYAEVAYFEDWIVSERATWIDNVSDGLTLSGPNTFNYIGLEDGQVRSELGEFFIKNYGNQAQTVTSVSLTNDTDFGVLSEDDLDNRSIGAEQYCQFGVTASANTTGAKNTTLSIAQSGTPASIQKTLRSTVIAADDDLASALDNQWSWFTGGDANWRDYIGINIFDGDFVQSGDIGNNSASYLQSYVTGPGYVKFEASVSSEEGFDGLAVLVNGGYAAVLTGEQSGTFSTGLLAEGQNKVVFAYIKDVTISEGDDHAQLNNVRLCTDSSDEDTCDQTLTSYAAPANQSYAVSCSSLNLTDVEVRSGTISSYPADRPSSTSDDDGLFGIGSFAWLLMTLPILIRPKKRFLTA